MEKAFSGVNHIGIVVGDLDRSVRIWADRYGIGPWQIFKFDRSNLLRTVLNGKPAKLELRTAQCQLSESIRFELLQPLGDDGVYAASLRRHGGRDHVHHIRFEVDDIGATTARMRELGVEVELELDARFGPRGPLAEGLYFATGDDLGFAAEVVDREPGFNLGDPEEVYPPQEPGELRF
jgi:catechol 2,3-dioxygenase-like lactoylglutathione lyase family enzyme